MGVSFPCSIRIRIFFFLCAFWLVSARHFFSPGSFWIFAPLPCSCVRRGALRCARFPSRLKVRLRDWRTYDGCKFSPLRCKERFKDGHLWFIFSCLMCSIAFVWTFAQISLDPANARILSTYRCLIPYAYFICARYFIGFPSQCREKQALLHDIFLVKREPVLLPCATTLRIAKSALARLIKHQHCLSNHLQIFIISPRAMQRNS